MCKIRTLKYLSNAKCCYKKFMIKAKVIQKVQNTMHFDGLLDKDPNAHLALFLQIYAIFKINKVSDDAIRLYLFPFSLRNTA